MPPVIRVAWRPCTASGMRGGGLLRVGNGCVQRKDEAMGPVNARDPSPVLDVQHDGIGDLAAIAYRPRNANGAVIEIQLAGLAEG